MKTVDEMTLKQVAQSIKANYDESILMNWVAYCYIIGIIKKHIINGQFKYKWGILTEVNHTNEINALEALASKVSDYRINKVVEHALWWAQAHKGDFR